MLERAKLFQDGNAWCALLGENIMDGISGWGDTPEEALENLKENMNIINNVFNQGDKKC